MTEQSPGARGVTAFEIEDVLLLESDCRVAKDFNPQAPWGEMATFAQRVSVAPEVIVQTRQGPQERSTPFNVVRYLFNVEVRLLKPDVQPLPEPENLTEDQIQATLRLLLAIDYRSKDDDQTKDPNVVGSFSTNAQFHVWPYVREEIHAMCGRLRIPRLTLPMLRTQPTQDGRGHTLTIATTK